MKQHCAAIVIVLACAQMLYAQARGQVVWKDRKRTAQNLNIAITIENVTCEDGKIRIGLYKDNGTFPNPYSRDVFTVRVVKPCANETTTILQGVPSGEYAIAIYHDINRNGKLDKDIFGRPAEPFGFSRNPALQMRIPKFSEASFITWPNLDQVLGIQLISLGKKK